MLTFLMMNPRVAMAGGVKCFKEIAFVAGAHPLKEESANFTTDFLKELVILPGSSNRYKYNKRVFKVDILPEPEIKCASKRVVKNTTLNIFCIAV